MGKIKVYSKNQCVKCMMTKKFLDQHNIPYVEINIDKKEDLESINKSYDEVIDYIKNELQLTVMPIIETPTDTWGDYRIDKLRNLIPSNES